MEETNAAMRNMCIIFILYLYAACLVTILSGSPLNIRDDFNGEMHATNKNPVRIESEFKETSDQNQRSGAYNSRNVHSKRRKHSVSISRFRNNPFIDFPKDYWENKSESHLLALLEKHRKRDRHYTIPHDVFQLPDLAEIDGHIVKIVPLPKTNMAGSVVKETEVNDYRNGGIQIEISQLEHPENKQKTQNHLSQHHNKDMHANGMKPSYKLGERNPAGEYDNNYPGADYDNGNPNAEYKYPDADYDYPEGGYDDGHPDGEYDSHPNDGYDDGHPDAKPDDSLSDDEYDHSLPDDEYDHSLPDDEYDHSLPDDEYDHSLPDDEYDHSLPDDEYDHSLPDDEYDHSLPDDEYDDSLPNQGYDGLPDDEYDDSLLSQGYDEYDDSLPSQGYDGPPDDEYDDSLPSQEYVDSQPDDEYNDSLPDDEYDGLPDDKYHAVHDDAGHREGHLDAGQREGHWSGKESKLVIDQKKDDINNTNLQSLEDSVEKNKTSRLLRIFTRENSTFECTTPKNESGRCRSFSECPIRSIVNNYNLFLEYMCLRGIFVGICCPNNPVVEISDSDEGNSTESELKDIEQPPEGCGLRHSTRIVGGTVSVPHEWSWMVALTRRDRFFCGGVIINNWYILTAAHCVLGVPVRDLKVRLGEYNFNEKNEHQRDIPVAEIKRHAMFATMTFQHDIALLKLKQRIEYSKFVGSICLPETSGRSYSDEKATVVGWGTVSFGGAASPILRQVTIPVWENEDCDRTYFLESIDDSFMCAGSPENGEDACQGDSGGPLMTVNSENRWEVIGIVSWGRRCGDPTYPGVYTRVTSYLDWISEHAK